MRQSRPLKPKKVKRIPKKVLDFLTLREKAEFILAFALRKNFKRKGFRIRFFKHKD